MHKRNFFLKFLGPSIISLSFLSGCLGNFLGTSVRQPKEGAAGTYSRSFNCSYEICFEETQNILNEMEALIFYKNKKEGIVSAMNFGKVYKNYIDTTEVGIFFIKAGARQTRIDVSCGNYDLARAVSDQVFSSLEQKLPKEKQ